MCAIGGNPLLWRYLNKIDVARIYNCLIQNNIDTINPWRYFLSFFDSVSFRGVQLASDDNMLPDSLKGFAPVVRGIAKSNAQITIKQNGYTIYQTYVSPGAFEISDLYSTSSSGDLLVEIKEADGSVNSSGYRHRVVSPLNPGFV